MIIFRRFFRHLREGIIGVKRHFGMAFSASSAVTITLLLVGVFGVFAVNMSFLTQEIEQSISLSWKKSTMSFTVQRMRNLISIIRNIRKWWNSLNSTGKTILSMMLS